MRRDISPTVALAAGNWNEELMPFSDCPNCSMPFAAFAGEGMSPDKPMHFSTTASDDRNIMLQVHGIGSEQLPWLGKLVGGDGVLQHRSFARYFADCVRGVAAVQRQRRFSWPRS